MHQGEDTIKLSETIKKRRNKIHTQDEFATKITKVCEKINIMKDDYNYKGITLITIIH